MALALLLVALAAAVWSPVLDAGFVSYDDPQVYEAVPRGLSTAGLRWAFGHTYYAHWAPLTVLSHMLDFELWGLRPAGHHLTSLLLHLLAVACCFLLWRRAGGHPWRAAAVAALFALHPLQVETVAWIGERKGVLAGALGLLALLLYVRWTERPSGGRMAATAAALAAGLLAKGVLVVLPAFMLLLDLWPLRRVGSPHQGGWRAEARAWRPRVAEKGWLLALAIAGGVAAAASQRTGGAMVALADHPVPARLAHAVIAYPTYLARLVWPSPLSAYHPLPLAGEDRPPVVAAAALALLAATAAAVAARRRYPWWTVGWLWFLVGLLPVIGLTQAGTQAIAERYVYLPSIALFAAAVWTGAELTRRRRPLRLAAGVLLAVALVAAAARTRAQIGVWHDDTTLYRRMVEVSPESDVGWNNLVSAHLAAGDTAGALREARRFATERPESGRAWALVGQTLRATGDASGARAALSRAVVLAPEDPLARLEMAALLDDLGSPGPALAQLAEVLARWPQHPRALAGVDGLLAGRLAPADALPWVEAVARRHPEAPAVDELLARLRAASLSGGARAPSPPR